MFLRFRKKIYNGDRKLNGEKLKFVHTDILEFFSISDDYLILSVRMWAAAK